MPVFGFESAWYERYGRLACHQHHHLCREPHKPKDNPPWNPVKYRHRLVLFLLQHFSSCPRSAVLCGTQWNIKPCRERFLVGSDTHCLPTTTATTTTTTRTPQRVPTKCRPQSQTSPQAVPESKKKEEREPPQPTNSAQPSQDTHPSIGTTTTWFSANFPSFQWHLSTE